MAEMDDEVTLARWLEGDLEADDAAALEGRLAREPDLAARADALADALWQLGDQPDVVVPEPATLRLQRRLHAETGPGSEAAGGSVPGGATPARVGSGTRVPWLLGGAAAALVLLVAVGSLVTGTGGDESTSEVADSAATEMAGNAATETVEEAGAAESAGGERTVVLADGREVGPSVLDGGAVLLAPPGRNDRQGGTDAALEAPSAAGGSGFNSASEGAASPSSEQTAASETSADTAAASEAAAPAPSPPDAALRDRYTRVPEADALLGLAAAETDDVARGFRERIAAAGPFADGQATDACLDEALATAPAGADSPSPVPVRVERTSIDGQEALVIVVVAAAPGADGLDRVEISVLDPGTCQVRRSLSG